MREPYRIEFDWELYKLSACFVRSWVVDITTHQGEHVVVTDTEQDARAVAMAWSNTGAMVVVWEL